MFTDLLNRLFHPDPAPLPELDGRHALAGLLVRTAKTDGLYAVEEIRRIDRILAKTYGLNPVEAAQLRAGAEKLEAQAPEDGRFATLVRERLDRAHREAVLVAMWRVALSDGVEQAAEGAYLARASERLGLDAEAIDRARKAAEQADPFQG
ncbi:TerB family tellurite resistance protein [Tropicimonas sp. TH_r6]|uniref:tellurite resistance TerB family protein n=1 Tax=Tropicimonas sp. TH_r6 TaxID=3082085 RepID=UPI00295323BB|nr:TerB family tellurite resistance protein [Tropicimonas sp. TH_r6]MDV7144481.1 TerB family tellurite resistance protein [Tropicimonas sp. TH_r6]